MVITTIPVPHFIRTDKDTHFTGSLATNAVEEENITGLKSPSGVIESVTITSDQNLDWDIYFWSTDGHSNTDLDSEYYLGKVRFVVADGDQIAGSGQYYYDTATSSYAFRPFPYYDRDAVGTTTVGQNELHIGLVNRNATSKNAGATGEVVVTVTIRYDEQTTLKQD